MGGPPLPGPLGHVSMALPVFEPSLQRNSDFYKAATRRRCPTLRRLTLSSIAPPRRFANYKATFPYPMARQILFLSYCVSLAASYQKRLKIR
jgi:hypothetical protein